MASPFPTGDNEIDKRRLLFGSELPSHPNLTNLPGQFIKMKSYEIFFRNLDGRRHEA